MKMPMAFVLGTVCAIASGCSGAASGPAGTGHPHQSHQKLNTSSSISAGAVPEWLPPYSKDQLSLLTPGDTPIQIPAKRVFPDLSRFGYARNHRMDDPSECLKFTRLIATVVTKSDHYYVVGIASDDLSNSIAQYGPKTPLEPDGRSTLKRDATGAGRPAIIELGGAAKQAHDEGLEHLNKRAFTGAAAAFKRAIANSPTVPLLHLSLAEALLSSGDTKGAGEAYEAALALDTTLSKAYTGLAETLEKKGDLSAAKRALAEALAYWPSSEKAFSAAERLTGRTSKKRRIQPFRAFIDVDSAGAVRVASNEDMASQMYGTCRAVMRYEPELRSLIFDEPGETPYYLSAVEEVVCLEAALGAYLLELRQDDDKKPDPRVEALLQMAQEDGLLGYVMFEVLGPHRPDRVHQAPPDVHRATVRYVSKYVLGTGSKGEELPEGIFSAQL